MLNDEKLHRVYLACGATDMRKSINGLSMMVQESFNLDPFDEAVFVFCNRNHNRIKILTWDGNGFWIYFKRLEHGHFKWPTVADSATMELDFEEFQQLLKGPQLEQKLRRKTILEPTIY